MRFAVILRAPVSDESFLSPVNQVEIAFAKTLSEQERWALMTNLCDLSTTEDVRTLVDSFYDKVGRDELLAPVFNDFAHVDWATHLPIMYRFWESMLFGAGPYEGAPFPKHAVLPVRKEHFARWLALFVETVNAHFTGPKAEEAKGRAASIADTFAQRMGLLKGASGLGPGIPVRAAGSHPEER